MGEKKGKLLICDRCGATDFSELDADMILDGGYSKFNKFKEVPGWSHEIIYRSERASPNLLLCPKCTNALAELHKEFLCQEVT